MATQKLGNWTIGRAGSVVSDIPTTTRPNTGTDDVNYYGGYLVAESIPSPEIARLIAAAPELLECLESVEPLVAEWYRERREMWGPEAGFDDDWGILPDMRTAIAKAKGQEGA